VARRARHGQPAVQERRAEVVRLRAEGKTWDEIARLTGFANGSAASKAWRAAIQQRPDLTVDEIRRAERERLEAMDSRLAQIIAQAPVKTTSIGRTQWDVRTCTCDVKADTKKEHEPGCQVQPVLDEHAVIAAIKERRQIGESLRKLTGADAAPALPALTEEQLIQMAKMQLAREHWAQGTPIPPLPPLPDGYDQMPPEQQARVSLERTRGQLAALPGAPRHVIPGHVTG
jgi:hypothetical protein